MGPIQGIYTQMGVRGKRIFLIKGSIPRTCNPSTQEVEAGGQCGLFNQQQ